MNMNLKKRLTAGFLAFVMATSLVTPAFAEEGVDAGEPLQSLGNEVITEYHVKAGALADPDGSHELPFMSIQEAIGAAQAAGLDEIVLHLDSNIPLEQRLELNGLDITIKSCEQAGGKYALTYEGADDIGNEGGFVKAANGAKVSLENIVLRKNTNVNGRILYVQDANVTLNDVTIQKGLVKDANVIDSSVDGGGAGIYVANGGKVTILGNSVIETNNTTGGGAGIFVADGGFAALCDSVKVSGNTAAMGAGIYVAAQTPSNNGGLVLEGRVQIADNTAGLNGGGVYLDTEAKASISGAVAISGNTVASAENNVYLAPAKEGSSVVATLDITGATTEADIGISADPEYAYRLVSLPVGYDIAPTTDGDEKGWHDDCGEWDIRHMTYNGVEGLYLYYKTLGVEISDISTLTSVEGKDLNGDVVDYMEKTVPGTTESNGTLSIPDVLPLNGEDYAIDFACDPALFRMPTEDVVSVEIDGEQIPCTYEADFENGTGNLVIPGSALKGKTGPLKVVISAEKYFALTLRMEGPLFAMTSSITGLAEKSLVLVEDSHEGESSQYKLTLDGEPAEGILVELTSAASGAVVKSALTDENGIAAFDGLDAEINYAPVLKYAKTYKVISRDVISVSLSTLAGQDLSAEYNNDAGEVAFDVSMKKATIANVENDGTVVFSIQQAKDTIQFVGNEGQATTAPATLSMVSKEMAAGANTYGTLAEASLTGYTFIGWFTAAVGGEQVTAETAYSTTASAKILYAHWQANTDTAYTVQHWVEFAEDGQNCRIDSAEKKTVNGTVYYLYETSAYADGESDAIKDISGLDLKEMTDDEITWWTRNGFTANAETDCKVLANGSSVFSIYYDRNAYPIVFVVPQEAGTSSNDEPIDGKDVDFGTKLGELPVPTLPGYSFGGWYEGETLVTKDTLLDRAAGMTLTAKWQARDDINWAIVLMRQDMAKYEDGMAYGKETYAELKTVYMDNEGRLLVGTADSELTFTIDSINALTVTGYNFIGYSFEKDELAQDLQDGTEGITIYVKPTDASTDFNGDFNKEFDGTIVYLYYDRKTADVIVKDDNGNDISDPDDKIVFGGDFTGHLPKAPGKDGYDFQGWVDEKGKPVTEETPADEYVKSGEVVVLRPTWKARKYNLTYVPGANAKFLLGAGVTGVAVKSTVVSGGYIDPHQVEYDQPMGVMPAAAKPGYVFDGWKLAGGTEFITSETNVDITNVVISNAPTYTYENTRPLYAQFTPHQYTLVLDAGVSSVTGEAGVTDPSRVTVTFDANVSGLPVPTLRGYTFMGWVLAEKPEVVIENGMKWTMVYTNGAEIPVKALWVPSNYRYTFNLNDQKGSTRGQLVDTTIDYVEETFDSVYDRIFAVEAIRPGYNFKGWSLTPTGDVLTADDLVALSENRTLYAIWEAKLYDVRLVMKGGAIADLTSNEDLETYDPTASYDAETDTWTIKVAFDSVYGELPIPVKTDCTFNGYLADAPGWPAKEGYGVTIHEQIITILPQYIDFEDEDGITLTAILEPWFTFDPDGGKFVKDDSTEPKKELQSTIEELPEVEKEGYTQKGWKDEDENPVTLEEIKESEEPKTLKPIYVPNVTLDPDGGKFTDDESEEKRELPIDELEKLPEVKKEGYIQEGWIDENGDPVTEDDIKNADKPITVKPAFFVSIIMDANGGRVNGKEKDEVRLDTLEELPTLTRSNYTFNGWFTAKDNGEKVELDALKAANKHVTIWAHWTYNAPPSGGGSWTPPPAPPVEEIEEPKTPLAGLEMLTDDHIAYIAGYPDGTVRPEANITRAEVAMIFYRLLREQTRAIYQTTESPFVDVAEGEWYATAIATLANAEILFGRGEGVFDPNAKITRAEFATICARFDDLEMDETIVFPDLDSDHWSYVYVMSAAAKGWVKGFEDGTFRPENFITRAEVMTLVNRVLKRAAELGELEATPDNREMVILWPDNSKNSVWYYSAVQEATHAHENESKFNADETLLIEKWLHIIEAEVTNE